MPNLLVGRIYQEIISSRAVKIYICNVMTQKGETEDYKASDHLRAIVEHTAPGIVDYCIINTAKIKPEMLAKYKTEEAYPVVPDSENLKKLKSKVIEAHIIKSEGYLRHDSEKVSKIIVDLASSLKKTR
jgi:uncharacterized cofD-like protein